MHKHNGSHLDHSLTAAQVAYIFERFADRDAFFIETLELPAELGTVPCGLYGPIMGDRPIVVEYEREGPKARITLEPRGARTWPSRIIEDLPARPTNKVTVIAGPHDGHACVLFTAFGGPQAPQEPGDPGCKDVAASEAFWSVHALAR